MISRVPLIDRGVSPVTKQSGKYPSVGFRWACNERFRNAIVTFADNSRHASPSAAGVYRGAIERGHDHSHTIRILGRAWIRVAWETPSRSCRPR